MNQDVDCVVRVRAKVNGRPVLLDKERVSVVLVRPDASREDAEITGVEGDAVRLHLGHDLLTQTGIYRLEVWLDRGGNRQMIGDRPAAFQLVPLSTQACDVADVYELGEVDMDFVSPFVWVTDSLDSDSGTDALSARQGGVLKRMIESATPQTGGGLEVRDGKVTVKISENFGGKPLGISTDNGLELRYGNGLVVVDGELRVGSGEGIDVGMGVRLLLDTRTGLNFDGRHLTLRIDTKVLDTNGIYDGGTHFRALTLKVATTYGNALSVDTSNHQGVGVFVGSGLVIDSYASPQRVFANIGSGLQFSTDYFNECAKISIRFGSGLRMGSNNDLTLMVGTALSLYGNGEVSVNVAGPLKVDNRNNLTVDIERLKEMLYASSSVSDDNTEKQTTI